jgi:C4-dicarboxylate transporter DctQ subunit
VLTSHLVAFDLLTVNMKTWNSMTPGQAACLPGRRRQGDRLERRRAPKREAELADTFRKQGLDVYAPNVNAPSASTRRRCTWRPTTPSPGRRHARQDQRDEVTAPPRRFAAPPSRGRCRRQSRIRGMPPVAAPLRRSGRGSPLLAVIFVAFIVQIVMRYVFNWPVGWTTELSLAAWLWLVLWGAAFCAQDDEEIRIDLPTGGGPRRRRVVQADRRLSVIVLFGMSLPASWSYVSFMKVEKRLLPWIRMDVMYSIYLVFVVAVIARCLRQLVRGVAPRRPTPHLLLCL